MTVISPFFVLNKIKKKAVPSQCCPALSWHPMQTPGWLDLTVGRPTLPGSVGIYFYTRNTRTGASSKPVASSKQAVAALGLAFQGRDAANSQSWAEFQGQRQRINKATRAQTHAQRGVVCGVWCVGGQDTTHGDTKRTGTDTRILEYLVLPFLGSTLFCTYLLGKMSLGVVCGEKGAGSIRWACRRLPHW